MKILVISLNYAPELTGIGKYSGEMVASLVKKGHEVRVVCAPPYYPDWKIRADFANKGYQKSEEAGALVYRIPIWVPREPTGLKRILHLFSFSLNGFPVIVSQIRWRPDLVWTVEPSLMSAPAVLLTSRLCRAKSWLHIQDYEVDAAFSLGILKNKFIKLIARKIDLSLMLAFDVVSSISGKMVERAEVLGVPKNRLCLFRNWVDVKSITPSNRLTEYRKELGIPESGVVVLYSGNMGNKQGIEIIPAAARRLIHRSDIYFILCGGGSARESLVEISNGLQNIRFLNLQPAEKLNSLLATADIHILPQTANAADLVMPSKLTGMLASGRAIIGTAYKQTELGAVLHEVGVVVDPGSDVELAGAIVTLADNPVLRTELGRKARSYAEAELSGDNVLSAFEQKIVKLFS